MTALRDYVTEIPNFPKKGILFRDITTVLSDKDGFKMAIDGLSRGRLSPNPTTWSMAPPRWRCT